MPLGLCLLSHPECLELLIEIFKKESNMLPRFTSVFIGVNQLRLRDCETLLTTVLPYRVKGTEWTVEILPEMITKKHLELFSAVGVNRLSLELKSFHLPFFKKEQNRLRHNKLSYVRKLLSAWKKKINIDLVCGLPGQSVENQQRDLEEAVRWPCDHISWYDFTIEEYSLLQKRFGSIKASCLDRDEAEHWWLNGKQFLKQKGFYPYDVSHFALKEGESCHQQSYSRVDPYLGLGPCAVSTLSRGPSQLPLRRYCPADVDDFKKNPLGESEILTARDLEKEILLMGLGTKTGILYADWSRRFKHSWTVRLSKTLKKWNNFLIKDKNRLALKSQGLLKLHSFLQEAFLELDSQDDPIFLTWP